MRWPGIRFLNQPVTSFLSPQRRAYRVGVMDSYLSATSFWSFWATTPLNYVCKLSLGAERPQAVSGREFRTGVGEGEKLRWGGGWGRKGRIYTRRSDGGTYNRLMERGRSLF
jgi:hypothetical protein